MFDVKALKERRNAAQREHDAFQPLQDDVDQFVLPFRKSTRNTGKGENRVNQVFDHTGLDSGMRFAGKFQQDFWPPGQDNFSLAVGTVVVDPKDREKLSQQYQLETVTRVCQSFFDDPDWDLSFHEMSWELVGGNGAMLMNSTDDPDRLWEPMSVPTGDLLLEGGRNGKITGIFWTQKMTLRALEDTWPEGKFSRDLADAIRQKPGSDIEVKTDTVYDRKKRRWHMLVWVDSQETMIHSSSSRTCPWLTPRYLRVPGETRGRGLANIAMPTIKTANTTARLQLQAAAIALLGIYTTVDDGVFNPDLAPLEPGTFWKVARNGGPLGPSVQRFPDPRLDLSNMILKDMQMGVKATMMDQTLPPDTAAVKSATEILERVKRLAADHIGAFGRLINEITVPAVKRSIELAYNRGLISQEIPIDQLLFQVKVKSPLALAREAQRVERIIQWLQMVIATMTSLQAPARAERIAKIEVALVEIGRSLGVPTEFIVTDDERAELDKKEAAEQAAMLAAAAAAGATGMPGATA